MRAGMSCGRTEHMQILEAIVQPIAVNVMDDLARLRTSNLAMFPFTIFACTKTPEVGI
jgi:hypothetical protein